MKKLNSRYSILLLLVVLFAAPGIAAYLFYQHPSWLGASRTNKGVLLAPPIALTSVTGQSKWRIIFWTPKACGQECFTQLDVLARVRLALGRKLYQVDQRLLLGKTDSVVNKSLEEALKGKDFKVSPLSATELEQLSRLSSQPRIFIMNPDNYLILSYQAGVNPDDVYKDLKTLLTTVETKNG